jgi:hypothetical protein
MKKAHSPKNISDSKWDTFFEICRRSALRLLKNEALAAEVAQDALGLALPRLMAGKVKKPEAYLRKITRHECLKHLQGPGAKDLSLDAPLKDSSGTLEDFVPAPGIEDARPMSAFAELERIDPGKAQGILRSIELVGELLQYKADLRRRRKEAVFLFDARAAVNAALKKLRLPTERTEQLRRYAALAEKNPFERTPEEDAELAELKENFLKLELQRGLADLRSLVEGFIYGDPALNSFIKTYGNFEDLEAVRRLRVQPIKILIAVWHRALKRGQYGNLKLIEALALELKERAWGTPRECLFAGLKEGNFNTIRKRALYSKNMAIRRFSDRIFELSFPPEAGGRRREARPG